MVYQHWLKYCGILLLRLQLNYKMFIDFFVSGTMRKIINYITELLIILIKLHLITKTHNVTYFKIRNNYKYHISQLLLPPSYHNLALA